MKRPLLHVLALGLLALPLAQGCGTRAESVNGGNTLPPKTSIASDKADSNYAGTGTIDAMSEPSEVRRFLNDSQIANGDIYLKDGMVCINIVGLSENTVRLLGDRYKAGTYRLVDVDHSIEDLQAAQQKLTDHDIYRQFNVYSSDLDIINNRVVISMPESSAAKAKPEIEKLIEPVLISYVIQQVGKEPEFVGTIVKVDSAYQRILILVDGEKDPSISFGFNEFSELADTNGSPILFADLKEKQKVRMWAAGGINMSMPAQATARRLELVVPNTTEEGKSRNQFASDD